METKNYFVSNYFLICCRNYCLFNRKIEKGKKNSKFNKTYKNVCKNSNLINFLLYEPGLNTFFRGKKFGLLYLSG